MSDNGLNFEEFILILKTNFCFSSGPSVFLAVLLANACLKNNSVFGRLMSVYGDFDLFGLCRFDGSAPEPRKGIRAGHVPGSKCIPFPQVA